MHCCESKMNPALKMATGSSRLESKQPILSMFMVFIIRYSHVYHSKKIAFFLCMFDAISSFHYEEISDLKIHKEQGPSYTVSRVHFLKSRVPLVKTSVALV